MGLVKAIENPLGQTESFSEELEEMWGCRSRLLPISRTLSWLECHAIEGDSPVEEKLRKIAG